MKNRIKKVTGVKEYPISTSDPFGLMVHRTANRVENLEWVMNNKITEVIEQKIKVKGRK